MMDLSTNIAGVQLSTCLMNASGARCVTQKELERLGGSFAGAIVTKKKGDMSAFDSGRHMIDQPLVTADDNKVFHGENVCLCTGMCIRGHGRYPAICRAAAGLQY